MPDSKALCTFLGIDDLQGRFAYVRGVSSKPQGPQSGCNRWSFCPGERDFSPNRSCHSFSVVDSQSESVTLGQTARMEVTASATGWTENKHRNIRRAQLATQTQGSGTTVN